MFQFGNVGSVEPVEVPVALPSKLLAVLKALLAALVTEFTSPDPALCVAAC